MAKCDPITYEGVTRQIFEGLKQELEAKGFSVPGPSGIISGPFSIQVEYDWSEGNQTLYTRVVDKSFFVPCSQIHDQLSQALNKYIA
ncbi:MAG: hypothetical protein H7Z75_21455 [Ferruginibacter sp.]|nr:hypothetical protein [Cytophagales bacterium]